MFLASILQAEFNSPWSLYIQLFKGKWILDSLSQPLKRLTNNKPLSSFRKERLCFFPFSDVDSIWKWSKRVTWLVPFVFWIHMASRTVLYLTWAMTWWGVGWCSVKPPGPAAAGWCAPLVQGQSNPLYPAQLHFTQNPVIIQLVYSFNHSSLIHSLINSIIHSHPFIHNSLLLSRNHWRINK